MAVEVVLNSPGVQELLQGQEVRRELLRRAEAVARAAGPGHRSQVERGRDRQRAAIWTDTMAARSSEANDHTLTRALDAAR